MTLSRLLAGDLQNGSLALQQGTQPELGSDVTPLEVHVERVSRSILRVKVGAAGRWEVPRSLFKTENASLGAPLHTRCLHALTFVGTSLLAAYAFWQQSRGMLDATGQPGREGISSMHTGRMLVQS